MGDGKGRKDRFVVLPSLTLACLRRYWREHRHPQWLFPGSASSATGTMDRQYAEGVFASDCRPQDPQESLDTWQVEQGLYRETRR